ncbi:tensin-1-like isoform X2 [Oppia nitens]|uniref:tensin-1-like isoform X2 n=1 Tax=Oppia nitens TaxID=1686743 RepID=UPI0023DA9EBE|nr:tensin-1-like isoform X2 [Oppia nitens]
MNADLIHKQESETRVRQAIDLVSEPRLESKPVLNPVIKSSLNKTHLFSEKPLNQTSFASTSYTTSESNSTTKQIVNDDNKRSIRTINLADKSSHYPPFVMDITYVTERIIALTFPDSGTSGTYRANLKEVVQMFRTKHKNKYMVFNLSERRNDLIKLNPNICEFGWHQNLAPPLERLCSICKAIDSWLTCDNQHVAVIHSKGDNGRTGVVIAAFMHYTNICATADQALDRFAMKRFYDDKLDYYMQPSQRRYVQYFSGLLSGTIKMNNNPLFLHHIIIHGIPNYDQRGGCRPFLKIYQGMHTIYRTGIYSATDGRAKKIFIVLNPSLQLRGDILIKCYHKRQSPPGRVPIFRIQFHTCTLEHDRLVYNKDELDNGMAESRFPNDGFIEILFNSSSENRPQNGSLSDAITPIVDEALHDSIVKWDSYENFDLSPEDKPDPQLDAFAAELNNPSHTYGPIDGSLYATVAKSGSKKSPVTFSLPNNSSADNASDDGPHTVSIDSGISSTVSGNPHHMGHTGNTNGGSGSSGYPSPINVEVEIHHQNGDDRPPNRPTTQEQQELDELLSGMLEQVQSFPDHPSATLRKSTSTTTHSSSSDTNHYSSITRTSNTPSFSQKHSEYSSPKSLFNGSSGQTTTTSPDVIQTRFLTKPISQSSDDKRPYRTPESQPFSYGVTASSPALQRRRVVSESTAYVTENTVPKGVVETEPRDADDVFSDYASSSYQETFSEDGIPLTWLQRQQLKLRSKHEGKSMQERYWKEQKLIQEFKTVAKRIPSQDSSRESSPPYSQPLHINTSNGKTPYKGNTRTSPYIPARSSSKNIWQDSDRPLQRQNSDITHDRERPFVAVQRVHQDARQVFFESQPTPQQMATSPSIYGSVYPYNQHQVYIPDAKDGLLMQTQAVDEVDSVRPKHSTPSYKSATEAPTSWSPSFVGSGSPNSDRPETPGFPITPGTPYVNQMSRSPPLFRKQTQSPLYMNGQNEQNRDSQPGSPGGSIYYGQSQRSSLLSLNESEVITQHPTFIKDTSSYWYKPNISREDAINMLRDKTSGTFIVRDSHSFPGAFGLALKVATPPPNVQTKTGDISSELVRHFLIEPTSKGVRLKGCPNEPTFGSLSALVYQHSVTPMALPCKLTIPNSDISGDLSVDSIMNSLTSDSSATLLAEGAACNILYLVTVDMESLTGPQALRKAITEMISMKPQPMPTVVHFKVSAKGITLTDNHHRLFFRRHYPLISISFCGIDPDCRQWKHQIEAIPLPSGQCIIFGFVARKTGSKTDNQCHVFAEYDADQPASAIVNFVNKVMATNPTQSQQRQNII